MTFLDENNKKGKKKINRRISNPLPSNSIYPPFREKL